MQVDRNPNPELRIPNSEFRHNASYRRRDFSVHGWALIASASVLGALTRGYLNFRDRSA